MGIGSSSFLATLGAILGFAVEVGVVDIQATGVILMITGAPGLALSLVYWDSWWGGWTPSSRRRAGRGSAGTRTSKVRWVPGRPASPPPHDGDDGALHW